MHKVKGRKITNITCKDLFTDNTKCNECVHYYAFYLIDFTLKHDCWVIHYREQISLKGKSAILYFMDPDRRYNNTINYPIVLEETIKRFYPELLEYFYMVEILL